MAAARTNPIALADRISVMDAYDMRPAGPGPGLPEGKDLGLDGLLILVARGDEGAFANLYDQGAGPVYGLIRKVLADPSHSEEAAQDALLEVWRAAAPLVPVQCSA